MLNNPENILTISPSPTPLPPLLADRLLCLVSLLQLVLLLLHLFCYLHLIHHSLNLNLHSHAYSGPVVNFTGQYIISSSYKEGGSPFSVSSNLTSSNQTLLDSYGKHTPLREAVSFSTQVIQYGLVFLMIASGVLFYYLRRKMRLNKAVEKLCDDLLYFNNELETVPSSGEIFSQIEKWPNLELYKLFGDNLTDILIIRNALSLMILVVGS